MIEQKAKLRKYIKNLVGQLTKEEAERASSVVQEKLLADDRLRDSHNVVVFWSMADEIYTPSIIDILSKKQKVYLPVIVGDDLEFRLYEGRSKMFPDAKYGILEPTSDVVLSMNAPSTTIIVPGVAFTSDGCRMGRGRGYYDRMLFLFPDAYKIGICYECQMVATLPIEPHDIVMDAVFFG